MNTETNHDFSQKKTNPDKLSRLLLELGFSPAMHGFAITRDALKLYISGVTKISTLNDMLARFYRVSPMAVEKNIRAALEVATNNGRLNRLNRICKSEVVRPGIRPSNKEFLATVAMLFSLGLYR